MSQVDLVTALLAASTALLAQRVSQPPDSADNTAPNSASQETLLAVLNALQATAGQTQPVGALPTTTPSTDDAPAADAQAADAPTPIDNVPDGRGTSVYIAHPQGDIGNVTGFACARCHTYNLFQDSRKTWYCILVGKRVGVYRGYHRIHDWVNGYRGNVFTKHRTLKEALRTWADAYTLSLIAFPPLHVRDITLPDPDFFREAMVPPYRGEVDEPEYISESESD
ncbi:hypothetical protein CC2G_007908 [Coprinopsis cinerea AmutBmut pab1-1]|nr:hypothetical protein CC2G_007908 [Coprinopsis cinerea AmutBmut pab1-1]